MKDVVNMRRFILLMSPLLLSGCFMYENFKCSLSNTCAEIPYVSENDLIDNIKKDIENRCKDIHNNKFGTIEFMECSENLKHWVNTLLDQYGIEDAADRYFATTIAQQDKCNGYGMKPGTKNFNKCIVKLEAQDIELTKQQIRMEQQQKQATFQALSEGMKSLSDSLPGGNPNNRVHCTSHIIGSTTYMNCY